MRLKYVADVNIQVHNYIMVSANILRFHGLTMKTDKQHW